MSYPRIDIVNIGSQPSRWRRMKRSILVAAAFTLPVAVWGAAGDQPGNAYAEAPAAAVSRTVGAGQDSYAAVVDAVSPAVVTIHAEQRIQAAQFSPFRGSPFGDDPLFREFFGDRLPRGEDIPERRAQGLGSGVIVRPDGYILTNHHVIDGADRITVELTDRRTLTAEVVGSDPPSDLAVLKVEAGGLPTVPLADSDQVKVGDVVLAVGNPMGVGQTVTMGIVSAKGRATGLGDGSFEDFLQTDAPINRGNSGGALVSTRGELVGINSQILSPSGGNIGIGFAIPANMAKHVMESLIADGMVHRGMLGVTVQGVTPDIAKSLGMERVRGALVSAVSEDGPADEAGLERGDVITAVNGSVVENSNDLRNTIAATKPGTRVELKVLRDGEERTLSATLDELASSSQATARAGGPDAEGGALGLAVEPVDQDRAKALGLENGQGLLIASVTPGSPAADAGFRRGDVIEEVNGSPVGSASALRQAVTSGNRPALVLVRRGDQSIFLTLSPRS